MSYNNNVKKHDKISSSSSSFSSWHHASGAALSSYSGNSSSLSMSTPSSHGDHQRIGDRGLHSHNHHHLHQHRSTGNRYLHRNRTCSSSHRDSTATISAGRNPAPPLSVHESGVPRMHMNRGAAPARRGGPAIEERPVSHNRSTSSSHSNKVANGNGDRFSGVPRDERGSSAYHRYPHHPHSTSLPLYPSSSTYVSNAFRGSAQDAPTTPPVSSISCQRITPFLSSQPQLPQHSGVTVRSGSTNTFNPNGGGGGTILYFSSIQKKGGAFTTTDRETQWQLNRRKRVPQEGGLHSSEKERSRSHFNEHEKITSSSSPEHPHQPQDRFSSGATSVPKKPVGYSSSLPLSFVEAKHMFSEADKNSDGCLLKQGEASTSLVLGVNGGNLTKHSSLSSSCVGNPQYRSSSSGGTTSVGVEVTTKVQDYLQTKKMFESRKKNRFELSLSDSDED